MKRLALAAAGAAVIGLSACNGSATPDAASAPRHTAVSCAHQYRAWTHGEGKGVMGALQGVSSAATAGDAGALTAALKQAEHAVAKGASHPIPACADPRGYWDVLLMHVNAATGAQGSADGARAAVQDVPQIHHRLLAEVKRTAS